MSTYLREYFNDDHEHKDHQDFAVNYTVHQLEQPVLEFTSKEFSGKVTYDADSSIYTFDGQFEGLNNATVKYWAANPIARNYSYSGSALPYPNPEVAYENTPNQGYSLLDNNGRFNIKLDSPSGYYVRQGKILLKPHVHFKVLDSDKVFTITIADFFPYRSLRNLPDRPNRSTNR
jgi:hypothetical protein